MTDTNNFNNQFVENIELRGIAILRGAAQIYTKELFQFIKINLVLTISFLSILFFFIFNYGNIIVDSIANITKDLYIHKSIGYSSIASLMMILLFWIFFSWLRASYLAAANGFFIKTNPLSCGLVKLVSFMMIELVRLVIFLVGVVLLPFLPFFIARYFLASAIIIGQNEDGISAMFESKEYMNGRIVKMIFCIFFINLFIFATIISCGLISHLLIKDPLILWSFNILLLTFLFLPLHSCCRFLLFKKLEHLDGESKVKVSSLKKFWFIFLRLLLVIIIAVAAFFLINNQFTEIFDSVLWFMLQSMAG